MHAHSASSLVVITPLAADGRKCLKEIPVVRRVLLSGEDGAVELGRGRPSPRRDACQADLGAPMRWRKTAGPAVGCPAGGKRIGQGRLHMTPQLGVSGIPDTQTCERHR